MSEFFQQKRVYHYIGQFILGLGILFLGLEIMTSSVGPLKDNPVFVGFIANLSRNPLLGILVGIITTCIIQSSSATIGILIALASQGIITFDAAVPVLLVITLGLVLPLSWPALEQTLTLGERQLLM